MQQEERQIVQEMAVSKQGFRMAVFPRLLPIENVVVITGEHQNTKVLSTNSSANCAKLPISHLLSSHTAVDVCLPPWQLTQGITQLWSLLKTMWGVTRLPKVVLFPTILCCGLAVCLISLPWVISPHEMRHNRASVR